MGRGVLMKKGEIERTNEKSVVGEVGREGLEGGGCKGVGRRRRGRQERREEQGTKVLGLTNGRRELVLWKVLVGRANGERGMVWELRGEGVWRRGRGEEGLIGWREIGGRWYCRSLGKRRRSRERRKMIGEEREWEVKVGDKGEEIWGWKRGESRGLGRRGFGGWRGEKMGLGEKDGEEFDQVKVALIPVLELHVPDEFVLGGHVVVSDHATVPPMAELHADESSDEMVGVRGGWGVEGRRLGGGGVTFDPSRPRG